MRGEQLIRDLDTLRAHVRLYTRFNLIGHSHGGPTARHVASVRPDLVASSVLGSPHTGSRVADGISTAFPPGSSGRALVAGFVDALSTFIGWLSGNSDPQYALGALASLSSGGAPRSMRAPAGDAQ